MKTNVVQDKSYKFALNIIFLCKHLRQAHTTIITKQLVRSGTSIGANVEEAMAAQSRKDFISKMAIASKEARETNYWLRLLRDSDANETPDYNDIISQCEELIKILTSIVKTSKETP